MADTRQKLERLIELTGYSLIQENGQRRYGPRPGARPPPRGSELFITSFPRDCYEDELVPVFAKVAPIYEMRLLMDFSGSNRGFAFLSYDDPEIAEAAIKFLHGYWIRPGYRLAVVRSVDNRRLYVGDLPWEATGEELRCALEHHVSESTIVELDMYQHQHCEDGARNRGFAFVEFESHRCASLARRKLVGQLRLNGRVLQVDWAEPEPYVPAHIMKTVMALYVRNLPATTTPQMIQELFQTATKSRVERVKKIKDYAFVHFYTRKDAERALRKLQQATFEGRQLQVKWAKPANHLVHIVKPGRENQQVLNRPRNAKAPLHLETGKPLRQECGSQELCSAGYKNPPTVQDLSPTGQKLSPTGQKLSPTGQKLIPTGQKLIPTGQKLSPTGQKQSPTGQKLSPTGQKLNPTGQKLSPTGQEQSPIVQDLSPFDNVLMAFSAESILDVQKEGNAAVSPWTWPAVHFYSSSFSCPEGQLRTEDFRLAPIKLEALCHRVGWAAPVYIPRQVDAYWQPVVELKWPSGQVVCLHDPRLCGSWEAAQALAAQNGIGFLHAIVAPKTGYTKPWTPLQQDLAAVDSGHCHGDQRLVYATPAVQYDPMSRVLAIEN